MATAPPGGEPPAGGPPADVVADRRRALWTRLARISIFALFIAMLILFGALKPDTFATFANGKAILQQAAIIAILCVGLTIVLSLGEFDLSFDTNAALCGAIAVQMMVNLHAGVVVGILAGIATGAIVGLANGALVAFFRAPAFIATLAMSSILGGINSAITGNDAVYGVPDSYTSIATNSIFGIPVFIWISVIIVLMAAGLLRYTVYGRRVRAVGANVKASESAGIRVRSVRAGGFILMGALAGVAGVLICSQSAGSSPTDSSGLLLPVYTAAFLGRSAWGTGQFNAIGSYFGVLFTGTLTTGLTMLAQPAWVANLVTGGVLVAAVLVARRE